MSENANNFEIVLNNERIWNFYRENPKIDVEQSNLLLVNFLEDLFNKMSSEITSNVNSQILSFLNENKTKMEKMTSKVENVDKNINKLSSELLDNVNLQLFKVKKDYTEEVSRLIENQSLQSKEKIENLLVKNSEFLLDKTTLLLNNIIPQNKTDNKELIQSSFQQFHNVLVQQTRELLENNNKSSSLELFLSNFDTKFNTLLQSVQQPLITMLSSTEDRLSNHLGIIKDNAVQSSTSQEKVFGELHEFLNKYKISSNRGKYGEQNLFEVLSTLYPSAEIKNTTGLKASGDFIMLRTEKSPVMFENKEYDQNINKDEITKFIRDIDQQNMNGIFMSQYSGICFKDNFQIEVHRGNVLIYIHTCQYNPEKIKVAVDIIDHLSIKIQDLNINENHSISQELLDNINEEFKHFLDQKEVLIQSIKDNQKKTIALIDNLKLPNLDKYLEPKYAQVKTRGFVCDICNNYNANSKQSLAAHKRGCIRKYGAANS